ncbi:MAG: ATP-dependent helicase RhlE [Chloroflexota bacterium]|nr:ATP-dependent helicase RhlE [Chloroflexota bacterium]
MQFTQFSFNPQILAGIQSAGYTEPTPIQEQSIPVILQGKDVLGLAQTGTGKTASFMLPILQLLGQHAPHKIRALIIAPTRELAEQIHETAVTLGKQTGLRSTAIYGGVSKNPQLQAIKRGVDIVVACPGRLLDLMNEKAIDLSQLEILVLDEADRMCDMGFLPDIRRILKRLPDQRQTLFFAATMPDDIRELADKILHDPVTVQIGMIAPTKTVSHALFPVSQALKSALVIALLPELNKDRVLIFTRTKYRARNLARKLDKRGFHTTALQGNMSQNQRLAALGGFRDGKYDILVATDIASRGIDVSEISHVINYDMPDTVDAYIHRIGRTGRAQASGKAFTFCTPDDERMVRDVEKVLGHKIQRRELEDFDYSAQPRKDTPSSSRSDRNASQSGKSKAPAQRGNHQGSRGQQRRNNAKKSY